MSFNKITIVGNLGRDVELKYTAAGVAVANISVATTEKRRNSDGDYEDVTTWFRVTLWGKMAENAAKFLKKGSPAYFEGSLRTEEWTDRDNNTRTSLEVNGTAMQFIGGGNRNNNEDDEEEEAPVKKAPKKAAAAAAGSAKKKTVVVAEDDDDDLDF